MKRKKSRKKRILEEKFTPNLEIGNKLFQVKKKCDFYILKSKEGIELRKSESIDDLLKDLKS